MKPFDRGVRSLFVALAVGLAWGIRGDFGHVLGASFPGAMLGLSFAFVSGQRAMFRWMPVMAAASALAIGAGGMMSYGILHGYAQSDTFINYSYGFFTLILEGGAWGTFGCGILGLLLEHDRVKLREWLTAPIVVVLSGCAFFLVVVRVCGFHINPPRSDLSIAFAGGAIGWIAWLAFAKRHYGLRGAILGYLGFGLGMAGARLLANASVHQPFPVNHWNIMEVGAGFFGGLVFAWGMLGHKAPEAPRNLRFTIASASAAVYVMGLIPLLHRLLRINPEKRLEEWVTALSGYSYVDAEAVSQTVLATIHATCVLAFLGALIWILAFVQRKSHLSAFPVLYLGAVMLLIQNLNALYFFYPRQEGTINMHFVFWVLFGLMMVLAFVIQSKGECLPDADFERVPWPRWALTGAVVYVLILAGASITNGEITMRSANTRWPVWAWTDGPFPR
ncbi:MAG: hypothetical protein IT365_05985 [Candidatus Hydrogenedentes bacterium]|nr:hypothetical protein [Candidatus Hydrogenedentota bacterium]